jgi:xylose isomerase
LRQLREQRYAGWQGPLGRGIEGGAFDLATLADHAMAENLIPTLASGRQELAEKLVADAAAR